MGDGSSPENAEYHCPKCDYNVRGLKEWRCPECGNPFSAGDLTTYKARRWPPHSVFRVFILATIPWFIAYCWVDAIHDTLDRIKPSWATFPFLFFPLQLVLATAAASALEASSMRSMKRFGAVLTFIVWILILGHIVITLRTL